MKKTHESYLRPFFEEMNQNFPGEWCVLHSYETLPYYSESDVDMAFSGVDIIALESLIVNVSEMTGWQLYQKLWYDVPSCYYYVLKQKNQDIFLALDFLIDNQGIGKYGFKTSLLTNKCVEFHATFPIPNHAVSFTYKLVKRIVKKRSLLEDEQYLLDHYSLANQVEVNTILLSQFGKEGTSIIMRYLKKRHGTLSEKEYSFLNAEKRKLTIGKFIILNRQYWEIKRLANRIFNPRGLIISIPTMSNTELEQFVTLLEERVNILFRFVRLNQPFSARQNFKGLIGSTLVVAVHKNFQSKKAVKSHWLYPSNSEVAISDCVAIDKMVDNYYNAILKALLRRKLFKNPMY